MTQSQSHPLTRIHFFGSLQIHKGDAPLPLKGEKARNLLAYLVLHPRITHRRETLASLLWPEAKPERVRRNLSDVLYRLQREFESSWLIVDTENIAIQPDVNLWVDLWEFERLINSQETQKLQKAIDLYTGDLLPEIYEDWVLAEREFRRAQFLSVLETLTYKLEGDGKLQDALLLARRLILREPLHEPAHQIYLRLLGRLRRFGEAFAHYDYLCELLRSELDSKPVPETSAIIEALVRERDLENVSPIEETRPFIGRKAERAAALTVVEAMLNGNGSLLSVEGEAGIGKSRLLREVMAGARWRGATVLYGQASETPTISPYSPLIDALSPLLDGPRGKQLETMIAVETLSLLSPIHSEWGIPSRSGTVPIDQAGRRFTNALNLFGETLAKLTPVVLILDDMHWADAILWECLRALAQGFVGHGGLIMIAYRRPGIETQPGWDFIQGWDRDGILKSITLSPFSIEEVALYLGEISGDDPAVVHAWAGGNPFFVDEWLAAPASGRSTQTASIPTRLQGLSSAARSALETASVLGESLPYRLWSEISELSSPVLAGLCDDLTASHWLQPSVAGYEFMHDLIRSAIYGQIDPAKRRILHDRAAHAYQTFEPDNLRARAFHFDRAGLEQEAAKAYRLSAQKDISRFAFREAQSALERALTLTPIQHTKERAEISIALTEVCHATGDRAREEFALAEALKNAQESEPHLLQALLVGGKFAAQTGQAAAAEERLGQALTLARRLGDHTQESEALILLGITAREQSHWNEAQTHYSQALELARAIHDPMREARALDGLAYALDDKGLPQEAIPLIEQSLELYRVAGEHWRLAFTQVGLMAILLNLFAWDHALDIAGQAIPVLDAYGDRPNAAVARHNQGRAYQLLGDYSSARKNFEHNIQVFESVRSRRALGVTQNVLGQIAAVEGSYEQALSLHDSALTLAKTVNSLDGQAYALHAIGDVYIKMGKPSEAIQHLETACALWTEQENHWEKLKSSILLGLALHTVGESDRAQELALESFEAFQAGNLKSDDYLDWLWTLHLVLNKLEMFEPAQIVLHAAYEELMRQAGAIKDPAYRQSFFENVKINRDLVAAHDRLAGASRTLTVSLARVDAPLGRSLNTDELVTVQWTVNAPEDESIADKAIRRQHRLKRLLAESVAQGAAPTDNDLANALGVSRRTILRDMQDLAQQIPSPPTRKRKK